jgi:hypothetical protein
MDMSFLNYRKIKSPPYGGFRGHKRRSATKNPVEALRYE